MLNLAVKNIMIGILNKNVKINTIVPNIFALKGIVEPHIKANTSAPNINIKLVNTNKILMYSIFPIHILSLL